MFIHCLVAIQRIHEIIRSEQNQTNQRYLSRNKPQLPPLMSIQTNVTSVSNFFSELQVHKFIVQ